MSAVKKLLSGFAKERLDRDLARAMRWNEKIRNSADFQRGAAGLSGKARSRVARPQAKVEVRMLYHVRLCQTKFAGEF